MAIPSLTATASQIASALGLSEDELSRQALISFLRDQKRQTLQLHLGILARYGTQSLADLEAKIAQGAVVEHPAWEDLIVVERLISDDPRQAIREFLSFVRLKLLDRT